MKNLFKSLFKTTGNVCINGVTYSGSSITINGDHVGGSVIVDGVNVQSGITGNIEVTVNGGCEEVSTMSGDIKVYGDILGNVKTMSGDVKARKISGKVNTMSGDITCQ